MDLLDQIARTRRQVTDHGTTKAVILTRTYDTSAVDLWDAWTNPGRLARWFEPVSGDLREGGRYRLDDSGTTGTIEQCAAPTRLRVTWEYGGDTSHVELTLSEANGRSILRLEHLVSDDEHWRAYGPGATGVGWDSSMLALALHLAGDRRAEPAQMEKYATSAEGAEFIRRTAGAWAEAHAGSGADRRRARATSERTIAAYTGAEQWG
ncbi:MAG TPA: SRPBCC domain-containing protein [Euzebyales bacterium]|nr:SRPBCC domain-containing protein [Euzebyales bacterium]